MLAELRLGDRSLMRVHSSGDFYDAEYVRKWREIAAAMPGVSFWAYTRSWRVPDILSELRRLAELPNFYLWFSCDRDTGLPPAVSRVRACWLQMEDETPPVPGVGEAGVELIFPVKWKDRTPAKRIGLALVCPNYNGTAAGAETTCERCGECWTLQRPGA
jgi:hypothetical protein